MHSHAGLLMLQPVQLLMVTLLVQAMVLAHVGQARMLELVLGSAHLCTHAGQVELIGCSRTICGEACHCMLRDSTELQRMHAAGRWAAFRPADCWAVHDTADMQVAGIVAAECSHVHDDATQYS